MRPTSKKQSKYGVWEHGDEFMHIFAIEVISKLVHILDMQFIPGTLGPDNYQPIITDWQFDINSISSYIPLAINAHFIT